jgi:hypothetical protein
MQKARKCGTIGGIMAKENVLKGSIPDEDVLKGDKHYAAGH